MTHMHASPAIERALNHVANKRRNAALAGIASYAREIGLYVDDQIRTGHLTNGETAPIRDALAIIQTHVGRLK